MEYNKIIFVAQTGTCREAMAAGIFGDFALKHPLEIQTRGLVVQFPEPMNQKAEAVLDDLTAVWEYISGCDNTINRNATN